MLYWALSFCMQNFAGIWKLWDSSFFFYFFQLIDGEELCFFSFFRVRVFGFVYAHINWFPLWSGRRQAIRYKTWKFTRNYFVSCTLTTKIEHNRLCGEQAHPRTGRDWRLIVLFIVVGQSLWFRHHVRCSFYHSIHKDNGGPRWVPIPKSKKMRKRKDWWGGSLSHSCNHPFAFVLLLRWSWGLEPWDSSSFAFSFGGPGAVVPGERALSRAQKYDLNSLLCKAWCVYQALRKN